MPNEPLLVGHDYQAIGPKEGSKLGPPSRVTVVDVCERGYVIEGIGKTRMPGTLIVFGCEHFWVPLVPTELVEREASPAAVVPVAAWSPWEGWE